MTRHVDSFDEIRTPFEAAHLAGNPHTTFSYWSPRQNLVAIDTVAHWVDDEATRRHVWELYRTTSPPGAGCDLGRSGRDPDDPTLQVLRREPPRIQVVDGRDLRGTVWRPTASAEITHSPGGRPS